MPVLRSCVVIAASLLGLEALAAAQTNPPPDGGQPPPPAVDQPPPQGYQQPPPGYQQQPPPGTYRQPPPPGAYQQPPPPGNYQQQPPGGYYQQPPPPGAYQPPSLPAGAYPPSAYQPAPPVLPPPRTHGFLALPYLGFSSIRGDAGSGLKPGAMFGVLLGGRVTPNFSINGELRFDAINFRDLPAGADRNAGEAELAFTPMFHLDFLTGEIVVGPKFGFFSYNDKDTMNGTPTGTYSASGTSYGINAGVFFPVSRIMSLGAMVSDTVRDAGQQCFTPPGGMKACTSANYAAQNIVGFHAAMLF